jgi:cytochrome c
MKTKLAALFALALATGLASHCFGAPADEATVLVKDAAALIKAEGKEKAFAAFTDPAGKFVKGDLYIFVVDYEGVTLAHGGNAKLVGKNMKDLKDADGKLFMQDMIQKAKGGGGWVDYKWTNPTTKKVQEKSTLVQAIEGANAFLGCGIYK